MPDICLYDDVPVLKNRLGIKDSDLLDVVCSDPVSYDETSDSPKAEGSSKAERYAKYQKGPYKPEPHHEKP